MFAHNLGKSTGKLILVIVLAVVVVASALTGRTALATPSSGITAETLASGVLDEPVDSKFKTEFGNVHTPVTRTMLVKYTILPGGVFGWHQHGGPLWVTVVQGDLTFYEADDPTCTPVVYRAGTTFMDPGNHAHNARNEGSENLVIYASFMLPEGSAPRIDAPNPGNCSW